MTPICSVDGCDRPVRCRGVCKNHHNKLLKYGDPTIDRAPTRGLSVEHRLAQRVDRSGGSDACWPWIGGGRHVFGYGQLWDPDLGRSEGAHRIAWRLANGPIPMGAAVLHMCDNPPCCNPAHLFLGNQRGNMADMDAKGRRVTPSRKGDRNSVAKLTPEKVRAIRLLRAGGVGPTEIARVFDVNRSTIKNVLSGRNWAHVS